MYSAGKTLVQAKAKWHKLEAIKVNIMWFLWNNNKGQGEYKLYTNQCSIESWSALWIRPRKEMFLICFFFSKLEQSTTLFLTSWYFSWYFWVFYFFFEFPAKKQITMLICGALYSMRTVMRNKSIFLFCLRSVFGHWLMESFYRYNLKN